MRLSGSLSKGLLLCAVLNAHLSQGNITPVSVAVFPSNICSQTRMGSAVHTVPVIRVHRFNFRTLRSPAVLVTFVTLKKQTNKQNPTKSAVYSPLWDCGTLFLLIISLREASLEGVGLGAITH